MNEASDRSDTRVLALDVAIFAEGVQRLAEKMYEGMQPDATSEQRTAADHAAHALLRNAPTAMRVISRLEIIAEDITAAPLFQSVKPGASIFGPDTE